jgi:O-antigen/teichoic acid export membrane protein
LAASGFIRRSLAAQQSTVLITQLLGPSQVLIFVLAQKIITLPQNFAYLATAPFISAFGEARVRGDWAWIRHAYRTCMAASLGLGLVLTVAVALVCRPVIAVWAGPTAVPDMSLVIWLSVYGMVAILTNPVAAVLSGFERVGVMASGLSFCAIGTIGLGILFGKHWGLIGLAAAMSLCLLFCFAVPAYYRSRQLLLHSSTEVSTVELDSQSIAV